MDLPIVLSDDDDENDDSFIETYRPTISHASTARSVGSHSLSRNPRERLLEEGKREDEGMSNLDRAIMREREEARRRDERYGSERWRGKWKNESGRYDRSIESINDERPKSKGHSLNSHEIKIPQPNSMRQVSSTTSSSNSSVLPSPVSAPSKQSAVLTSSSSSPVPKAKPTSLGANTKYNSAQPFSHMNRSTSTPRRESWKSQPVIDIIDLDSSPDPEPHPQTIMSNSQSQLQPQPLIQPRPDRSCDIEADEEEVMFMGQNQGGVGSRGKAEGEEIIVLESSDDEEEKVKQTEKEMVLLAGNDNEVVLEGQDRQGRTGGEVASGVTMEVEDKESIIDPRTQVQEKYQTQNSAFSSNSKSFNHSSTINFPSSDNNKADIPNNSISNSRSINLTSKSTSIPKDPYASSNPIRSHLKHSLPPTSTVTQDSAKTNLALPNRNDKEKNEILVIDDSDDEKEKGSGGVSITGSGGKKERMVLEEDNDLYIPPPFSLGSKVRRSSDLPGSVAHRQIPLKSHSDIDHKAAQSTNLLESPSFSSCSDESTEESRRFESIIGSRQITMEASDHLDVGRKEEDEKKRAIREGDESAVKYGEKRRREGGTGDNEDERGDIKKKKSNLESRRGSGRESTRSESTVTSRFAETSQTLPIASTSRSLLTPLPVPLPVTEPVPAENLPAPKRYTTEEIDQIKAVSWRNYLGTGLSDRGTNQGEKKSERKEKSSLRDARSETSSVSEREGEGMEDIDSTISPALHVGADKPKRLNVSRLETLPMIEKVLSTAKDESSNHQGKREREVCASPALVEDISTDSQGMMSGGVRGRGREDGKEKQGYSGWISQKIFSQDGEREEGGTNQSDRGVGGNGMEIDTEVEGREALRLPARKRPNNLENATSKESRLEAQVRERMYQKIFDDSVKRKMKIDKDRRKARAEMLNNRPFFGISRGDEDFIATAKHSTRPKPPKISDEDESGGLEEKLGELAIQGPPNLMLKTLTEEVEDQLSSLSFYDQMSDWETIGDSELKRLQEIDKERERVVSHRVPTDKHSGATMVMSSTKVHLIGVALEIKEVNPYRWRSSWQYSRLEDNLTPKDLAFRNRWAMFIDQEKRFGHRELIPIMSRFVDANRAWIRENGLKDVVRDGFEVLIKTRRPDKRGANALTLTNEVEAIMKTI